MADKNYAHCATCRTLTHIDLLDAKPASLKGVPCTGEQLSQAADSGEDFDHLECFDCYGTAWNPMETGALRMLTPDQRAIYCERIAPPRLGFGQFDELSSVTAWRAEFIAGRFVDDHIDWIKGRRA